MIFFPLLLCFMFGSILLGMFNLNWIWEPNQTNGAQMQKDMYFTVIGALAMFICGMWFITIDRKIKVMGLLLANGSTQEQRQVWLAASHSYNRQLGINLLVTFVSAIAFTYALSTNLGNLIITALLVASFCSIVYFFVSRHYYSLHNPVTESDMKNHLMSVTRREIVMSSFLLLLAGVLLSRYTDEMYRSARFAECTAWTLSIAIGLVYYHLRGPTSSQLGDSQLATAVISIIIAILAQLVNSTWVIQPAGLQFLTYTGP